MEKVQGFCQTCLCCTCVVCEIFVYGLDNAWYVDKKNDLQSNKFLFLNFFGKGGVSEA